MFGFTMKVVMLNGFSTVALANTSGVMASRQTPCKPCTAMSTSI